MIAATGDCAIEFLTLAAGWGIIPPLTTRNTRMPEGSCSPFPSRYLSLRPF
jgi:hypothetical protein